ncbi:hypothetical protein HDC36_003199 [Xanthomonas sp. JAI131]|uniref:hypothetical protein n=1 Tax=Xanthomonas sp. JAI131 TaxID=2723067 RepID=UPI0017C35D08|nr:hypothetical protein [Xanthomonas sp. JAI131]NYF21730.1 hypothetical protein [Xanthomonas sp. JAI131]
MSLRLGAVLLHELLVALQVGRDFASGQGKAAMVLGGAVVVVFVNVVLALATAMREIAVFDEVLHQRLRLCLHIETIGPVNAVMGAGAIDELAQARSRCGPRRRIGIEA